MEAVQEHARDYVKGVCGLVCVLSREEQGRGCGLACVGLWLGLRLGLEGAGMSGPA